MIGNDWDEILEKEFLKPYFIELKNNITKDYEKHTCYPPINKVYDAFRLSSFTNTKVLILGQDPYHNPGQAMGLAFSVPEDVKVPPSLVNIYKEYCSDLALQKPVSGDLSKWAKQGVLLLNAILSVRENQPLAHKDYGWMTFTDEIIKTLNKKSTPVIFVLWGGFARNKKKLITNKQHLIIENVHPSPLSSYRGFFGSKPFSEINKFLTKTNQEKIDFNLGD